MRHHAQTLHCARRPGSIHVRRARIGGFTLVEVMLSAMVLTLIAGATTSVLILAGRSLSASASGASSQSSAASTLTQQITSDLQMALTFSEQTSTSIQFTVPDRNGDGQPETIRYAWSGANGATITLNSTIYTIGPNTVTYQYNGGPPLTLSTGVQNLNFQYLTRAPRQATTPTGSAEPFGSRRSRGYLEFWIERSRLRMLDQAIADCHGCGLGRRGEPPPCIDSAIGKFLRATRLSSSHSTRMGQLALA